MNDIFAERQKALARLLKTNGLDVAAIVPGANFYYYSGVRLHLMERPTLLFITSEMQTLAIIPELERSVWSAAMPQATTFYWQDSDGYDDAFAAAMKEIGAATFGIEGQRMRAFEMLALRKHVSDNAIQDAQSILSGPRLNKTGTEIELLERAIEITETSLHETLEAIRTGMTELEIKSILVQRMHANGADDLAFEPIVLAGPNSANPHGHAGEHRLAPGEPLLFDFGASYGGYNADITRTVFCEYASEEHELFYNTVLAANTLGRDISKPGLTCDDLDNQVTDVLRASPFAKFVVHKTGHGLGLDVHEAPQVMAGNFTALEEGTVITIEPGLYKTGDIGVRVEDDVLITADGARSLTRFPREIRFVGGAA